MSKAVTSKVAGTQLPNPITLTLYHIDFTIWSYHLHRCLWWMSCIIFCLLFSLGCIRCRLVCTTHQRYIR